MALDKRLKQLLLDGDRMFTRGSLMSFWQEAAEQFYPEMAEFTSKRSLGDEFADHLTTSYPLIARRTLGDSLGALLRPVNLDTTSPGVWFSIRSGGKEDTEARRWLEAATLTQRKAMYDPDSAFTRATKEGDHTFATFGQCVISLGLNIARDTLLYQSWHLRDVAWTENAEGKIDHVQRKWKPSASQLARTFPGKVHAKVMEKLKDDPFAEIVCRHIVIETDNYEQRDSNGNKFRTKWVSVWIDVTNDHLMEEVGSRSRIYIIPRWVTVPGSQYASSPAVTAALPDARLIQAMTLTLLEASEKWADPPIIAKEEVIKSGIELFAGGTTWIDAGYDQKLSEAIGPMYHPAAGQGVGTGMAMRDDTREMISKAFFLDSLALPPASAKEMTAFEVGERISEWIRRAMPIFEPMEFEYNAGLCLETFDLLLNNGAFGPFSEIPDSIKGAEFDFKFESPIHESVDRRKGQKLLEAQAALAQVAQIDPSVVPMIDGKKALRDVFTGIGVPAEWQRSDAELEEMEKARQEQEQEQQTLAGGQEAAGIAKDLGSAVKDFAGAQAV